MAHFAEAGRSLFVEAVGSTAHAVGGNFDEWHACIRIIGAYDLPKADGMFGKIDPYAILRGDVASSAARTHALQRNYNPVWNADAIITSSDRGASLDVWDEDTMSNDDKVATVRLPAISTMVIGQPISLDLSLLKGKPRGKARVEVQLVWRVRTARALAERSPHAVLAQPNIVNFRLPDFEGQGPMFLSLEFEKGGKRADVRIIETSPPEQHSQCWVQMFGVPGDDHDKIRYQSMKHEPKQVCGISCWRETKLDDVPSFALSRISVRISRVATVTYADTLSALSQEHGWRGMLNYQAAKRTLVNCQFDDDHQYAYFVEADKGFAFQNDWDSDNCDLTILAFDTYVQAGFVVDMTHKKTTKRTHRIYRPGHPKLLKGLHGLAIGQLASIDDLPMPMAHADLTMSVFQLYSGPNEYTVGQLLPM
mmetsp:Transcript_18236/g.35828  ORF Transcript_18236/g.35828 Transcript_18236/m.35828 type:complete len:422 (-) Transcript_18236:157-1422(-)|eukprot:CAMPEP_0171541842 /NCGR_PEP_ID=MMETSP0960-20121227/2004_1 /TAXON_ID=87120 /ORGANISM="Aurantiochytrium limacinum, Strain ATCCMYA-1381" /LENGTH=421 /DNA_ID=CAMNT_0012089253 /DNA_START=37 /DNA_END=1305 /DNA_ORIENTATION=+